MIHQYKSEGLSNRAIARRLGIDRKTVKRHLCQDARDPRALQEIWMAETRADANQAFDRFIDTYQDRYLQATDNLLTDGEELMAFYDFPSKHWQSIRTTNPIESTFATVRHRTRRSKGCLNRNGMLCMMFKLARCAETRWRRLRGFRQLGQVIEGVKFKDGIEVNQLCDQVAA